MTHPKSLCQIHLYLKAKEGMGKLKQFLNILGSEIQLDICKIELQKTLETLQMSRFDISAMMRTNQNFSFTGGSLKLRPPPVYK
jgi:hypothetical protein